MRRPLFTACLCLVAIAALRLWLCHSFQSNCRGTELLSWLNRETDAGLLTELEGETVTVTGRVCQRDARTFSLNSVSVVSSSNSDVAVSQQNFSEQDKTSKRNSQMQSVNQRLTDSDNFMQLPEKWICEYVEGKSGNPENGEKESPEVKIGSIVTVKGELRLFRSATNPGEFDTAEYYRTIGVGGRIVNAGVIACGENFSRLRESLYKLKHYFLRRLYKVFPEKEASVMTAMLLGDKENLDAGVKELYKENGIIHILSISGLHITLIGVVVYRLLRKMGLPIWLSAVLGSVVLVLYGVMTGMGVSACRAIGMYVIRMLGEVVGRTYDMLTALAVMAVVLIWRNPAYLKHAGFLLSFGSVLGIGVVYPALSCIFYIPEKNKRLQALMASMSITLFTLPIQLWFYYEVPTYAVFLNLLVLPFMSIVMASGMIVMLLPGTGIVGTITCLILKGYEVLCMGFQQLPSHTWNPGRPMLWQVVVYYVILLLVCGIAELVKEGNGISEKKKETQGNAKLRNVELKNKEQNGKVVGEKARVNVEYAANLKRSIAYMSVSTLAIVTAVLVLGIRVRTGSTVTFLDVGQGDCILIETKEEVYLFDCGSSSRQKVGEYVLLPYLKYRGIRRIDAVFASHSDGDHINGIQELLKLSEQEGILVEQLVLPGIANGAREEEFVEFLELPRGVFTCYIQAGDRFEGDGVSFTCLHPPRNYKPEDSNAYSECFYVKFDEGASLLLTGDVEGEGEEFLLQELENRGIDDITMLKVAHHGSKNSTSEELLAQICPSVSIISCGRNNRYGHPHKETVERLEECGTRFFLTPKSGAITVEIENEKIILEEFCVKE